MYSEFKYESSLCVTTLLTQVNVDGTYTNNKSPGGRGGVFAVNRLYSGGRMNIKGTYINNFAKNTGGTLYTTSLAPVGYI